MIENDKNSDAIKESIAVLLMDMIKTDSLVSAKEKQKFIKIFTSYYKMIEEDALGLFEKLSADGGDIDLHIAQIKEKFASNPVQKLEIMKNLNEMIFVDSIVDIEYEKFDKIKNALM